MSAAESGSSLEDGEGARGVFSAAGDVDLNLLVEAGVEEFPLELLRDRRRPLVRRRRRPRGVELADHLIPTHRTQGSKATPLSTSASV